MNNSDVVLGAYLIYKYKIPTVLTRKLCYKNDEK
jgi:hypothetical protein